MSQCSLLRGAKRVSEPLILSDRQVKEGGRSEAKGELKKKKRGWQGEEGGVSEIQAKLWKEGWV